MFYVDKKRQSKQENSLTNGPNCPVVDKLPGAESKVLEGQILQLFLPRLKAVVGKENNGSVIPTKNQAEKAAVLMG